MSDLAFAVGDNIAVSDNIVDLAVLVTGTEYRSLKKIQNHFIKKNETPNVSRNIS